MIAFNLSFSSIEFMALLCFIHFVCLFLFLLPVLCVWILFKNASSHSRFRFFLSRLSILVWLFFTIWFDAFVSILALKRILITRMLMTGMVMEEMVMTLMVMTGMVMRGRVEGNFRAV